MSERTQIARTRRTGLGVVFGVALIVLIVLAVSLVRGGSDKPDAQTYRVDAVFDAARGIGARQVVKIAGARVGTVEGVHLTSKFQARVEMKIDKRFAPFRADATCAIKPEGLISENFIGCDPGDASSPPLRKAADGTPTVPVKQTAAPVSLQDLFQIFNVPTTQRLQVLINELGMAVAGRGDDLNSILYRANPTLAAARKAISVVNRQRSQLVELLDATEPVITQLAQRNPDVKRFIDETAKLTTTTATHRGALAEGIRRLPPLLRAARPALRELSDVAESAPQTLRNLRASAPALSRFTRDITPFSTSAVSTLDALQKPTEQTTVALRRGTPVLKLLGTFAEHADPAGESLVRFLVSLRDSGSADNLLRLYFGAAGATNRFDSNGHHLVFLGNLNACSLYATTPTAGCDGQLDGKDTANVSGTSTARSRTTAPRTHAPARTTPSSATPPATTTQTQTSTTPQTTTKTSPLPKIPLPAVTGPTGGSGSSGGDAAVKKILDYVLGGK